MFKLSSLKGVVSSILSVWYVEILAIAFSVFAYTHVPLFIDGCLWVLSMRASSFYKNYRVVKHGMIVQQRAPVSLMPFFKNSNNPYSQKKVFVAYFGTLKRGVNYTLESHRRHIFEPLMQK